MLASSKPKGVKKGTDIEDKRRARENRSIALRKEKREEGVDKRRRAPVDDAPVAAAAGSTLPAELSVDHLAAYCEGASGLRARRARARGVRSPSRSRLFFHSAAARTEDPARMLEGVVLIRRLLSKESSPPVEAVLKANILPRLVHILGAATDPKLQFEAAWAITNIASTEYTRHVRYHARAARACIVCERVPHVPPPAASPLQVVDAGAVGPLVAGMMSGDATLRDQCIWCIGNIAGDCAKCVTCARAHAP